MRRSSIGVSVCESAIEGVGVAGTRSSIGVCTSAAGSLRCAVMPRTGQR